MAIAHEEQKAEVTHMKIEEAKKCKVLEQGKTYYYSWQSVYKNSFTFLFREAPKDPHHFIQDVENYKKFVSDIKRFHHLLDVIPKYLKIAKPMEGVEMIADYDKVEILQTYSGTPLNNIYSNIERHFEEAEIHIGSRAPLKIKYMIKIFSDAAMHLQNANVIHGELFPSNILFDFNIGRVSFLCGTSITDSAEIGGVKCFRPKIINYYNSISYGNDPNCKLDASEARNADIISLALCIYDIGFKNERNYYDGVDNALPDQENILLIAKENVEAQKLLTLITNIKLNTRHWSYNEIITELQQIQKIEDLSTKKPLEIKALYKTKLKDESKIKEIKTFTNNIILIVYPSNSFVIKVYKKPEYYDCEKKVLDFLELKFGKDPDDNDVDSPNDPVPRQKINFLRKKNNLVTAENELAIYYKGGDFYKMFKTSSIREISEHCISIINVLMESLEKANMFHGDIKEENLSLEYNWTPYLFDYDAAQIDLPKKITEKSNISIRGYTSQYCSPEILFALLSRSSSSAPIIVNMIPFKADIYSLAKTLIYSITKKATDVSIFNAFYRETEESTVNNEDEWKKRMVFRIKNKNLFNQAKSVFDSEKHDLVTKIMFYYENNDLFVKNVNAYKVSETLSQSNINEIMKFLAKCCSTNPDYRPRNTTDIKNLTKFIDKSPLETHIEDEDPNKYEKFIVEVIDHHIFPQLFKLDNISMAYVEQTDTKDKVKVTFSDIIIDKDAFTGPEEEQRYKIICDLKHKYHQYTTEVLPPQAKYVYSINFDSRKMNLYCIGGRVSAEKAVNTAYLFDREKRDLYSVGSMNYCRYSFGVTSWKGRIAVAGGEGRDSKAASSEDKPLNTLEIYDIKKNNWNIIRKFKTPRSEPVLVYIYRSNKLFIIGGYQESESTALADYQGSDEVPCTIDMCDLNNRDVPNGHEIENIKLNTKVYGEIEDGPAFEYVTGQFSKETNQILILKDFLMQNQDQRSTILSNFDINFNSMGQSLFIIQNKECNIESFEVQKESDWTTKTEYTGVSSYNSIMLQDDVLIFPQCMETEANESKRCVMRYDIKNRKFTTITTNEEEKENEDDLNQIANVQA